MIMNNKITKKDALTIPNILTYIRILLIPLFIWRFCVALFGPEEHYFNYYIAAGIVIFSGLTDMLDGKIARRFNQITELGKLIDPVADKLTQGAVVFCLALKYELMWVLFGLLVFKELFMGVMGLINLKRYRKKLDGALWYGKVCTTIFYLVVSAMLLFPSMPEWLANTLIIICGCVLLATFVLYARVLIELNSHELNEKVADVAPRNETDDKTRKAE